MGCPLGRKIIGLGYLEVWFSMTPILLLWDPPENWTPISDPTWPPVTPTVIPGWSTIITCSNGVEHFLFPWPPCSYLSWLTGRRPVNENVTLEIKSKQIMPTIILIKSNTCCHDKKSQDFSTSQVRLLRPNKILGKVMKLSKLFKGQFDPMLIHLCLVVRANKKLYRFY